jgi:hypothetical protein
VVNQVEFLKDGQTVAACSADRSLKLWDVRSHQLIQHYPAHTSGVTALSIHPSGNYALTSSKDSSLRIWDIREGRLVYTLHGHTGPALAAKFSQDGNFFASGGADQLVMVWRSNLMGLGGDTAPETVQQSGEEPSRFPRAFGEAAPLPSTTDRRPTAPPARVVPTATREGLAPAKKQTLVAAANARKAATSNAAQSHGPHGPVTSLSSLGQPGRPSSAPAPSSLNLHQHSMGQHSMGQPGGTGAEERVAFDRDQLPAALVGALDHIVGQVWHVIQTMHIHSLTLLLCFSWISSHAQCLFWTTV